MKKWLEVIGIRYKKPEEVSSMDVNKKNTILEPKIKKESDILSDLGGKISWRISIWEANFGKGVSFFLTVVKDSTNNLFCKIPFIISCFPLHARLAFRDRKIPSEADRGGGPRSASRSMAKIPSLRGSPSSFIFQRPRLNFKGTKRIRWAWEHTPVV